MAKVTIVIDDQVAEDGESFIRVRAHAEPTMPTLSEGVLDVGSFTPAQEIAQGIISILHTELGGEVVTPT